MITVVPYQRPHQQAVLDLLFHSYRIHTHLDWQHADHWLDTPALPIYLAWEQGRLVGVMGVSLPLDHICWIRMAAVHQNVPSGSVLQALWKELFRKLKSLAIHSVWLLVNNDWIGKHIGTLGFRYLEDVVTLRRDSTRLPIRELPPVTTRSAIMEDFKRIIVVDQAAFGSPWQLTLDELRLAWRLAASCTVTLLDNEIMGYQLSTQYRASGHLARLAVIPGQQGKGVGAALLDDLIRRFLRRGVQVFTVNTQVSNQRSQRLYERYGFQRNGYDLPVWVFRM